MSEETLNKVQSIITNIKRTQSTNHKTGDAQSKVTLSKEKHEKRKQDVPRGIPKSGRFWKSNKERFNSVNKTKGLKLDFQKKAALRLELKRTKELSRQVQEDMKQKELERKERRKQNILRTEENKRKSEVVQVITNTAKLKRMRKKQLRFIQKRDTTKEVEASK